MAEQTLTKAEAEAADHEQERRKVVQRIVRRRKAGLGYPAIAKELNEAGIPSFGGGKTWHPPVVRGICIREFGGAEESIKEAGTKAPAETTAPKKGAAKGGRAGKRKTGSGSSSKPQPSGKPD